MRIMLASRDFIFLTTVGAVLFLHGTTFAASSSSSSVSMQTEKGKVQSVVDGDTIKVKIGDMNETVRIIGIDTPETVDPRKPVQCYGKEASAQMKKLVEGKTVTLEKNQGDERDKYGRLLRYVFVGKKDIGATMVQDGYALSYKIYPHSKLTAYNALEKTTKRDKKGLWGDVCNVAALSSSSKAKSSAKSSPSISSKAPATTVSTPINCDIKGNISSSKERIYHVPGCASYKLTVIDSSKGERMFCTESDAVAAGWRKALNCPQ